MCRLYLNEVRHYPAPVKSINQHIWNIIRSISQYNKYAYFTYRSWILNSTNQSISQSIDQTNNQSINQSTDQSINQSINQSIDRLEELLKIIEAREHEESIS